LAIVGIDHTPAHLVHTHPVVVAYTAVTSIIVRVPGIADGHEVHGESVHPTAKSIGKSRRGKEGEDGEVFEFHGALIH
jgi:hypothetical protein